MNRTLRVSDAITSYQRRHGLTTAQVAAQLETSEQLVADLQRWSVGDFTRRPKGIMIGYLAEFARCDYEGLAVILLEAGEFVDHA